MSLFEVISVVALIGSSIFSIINYFHAVTTYKAIDYQEYSTDNVEPWRWRKPNETLGILFHDDVCLELKDNETVSSLFLPQRFNLGEWMVHLLGYMFAGTAIVTLLGSLFQGGDSFWWQILGFVLFFGIACLCLNIGDQVVKIDLYPDHMEVITKYALFLYRKNCYKPSKRLQFKGKHQSFLGVDRTQENPDYKITIIRPFLGIFKSQRTFFLACNKTQGSWITSGLQHWSQTALLLKLERQDLPDLGSTFRASNTKT